MTQRSGICAVGDFLEAEPARWSALARVHDPALLGRILARGTQRARAARLFNDIALAIDTLRKAGSARTALVVDCDVHQGDGTAHLLGPDRLVFTLSLHGARNYPAKRIPSDLDVDLARGTGDGDYLTALEAALATALDAGPYDTRSTWRAPTHGRATDLAPPLSPSTACATATSSSSTPLSAHGIPVCVTLAGGRRHVTLPG